MVRDNAHWGDSRVATAFGVGASAIGPLIVAVGYRITGSYGSLNLFLALIPSIAIIASVAVKEPSSRSNS